MRFAVQQLLELYEKHLPYLLRNPHVKFEALSFKQCDRRDCDGMRCKIAVEIATIDHPSLEIGKKHFEVFVNWLPLEQNYRTWDLA